jgi:hypothetical protein
MPITPNTGSLFHAETHRDCLAAGQHRDVLQHGFAAIAEARSLDGRDLQATAEGVTFTALLRISTPRNMRSWASTPNLTSLADIVISVFNWSDPKDRATGELLRDEI